MPASVFYRLPQLKTTTLATVGGIDASQTTGIKLLSVTNVETTKPGIICVNWSNPIDTAVYEYITYASIDGNQELVGATRGAENSTGRVHSNGVTIAYIVSKAHINEIVKALDGTNTGVTLTSPTFSGSATGTYTLAGTATLTSPTLTTPTITTPTIRAYDGWIDANETWTYASANTVNTPAGGAALRAVGDRVKFTQTTVKYFVVTAVADTLLTFAVNTDYTVANAAISANYYSHEASPIGYPQWFSTAAPSMTVAYFDDGSGGQPTISETRYSITGRTCHVHIRGSGTKAGSNINIMLFSFTALPPINSAKYTSISTCGVAYVNATGTTGIGLMCITTQFITAYETSIADNVVLTDVATDFSYEI